MKALFVAIIVTLLLAALLATAMTYDPGYILVSYGLYTLETTVWVGVVALLGWLLLCWLAVALLARAGRVGAFGHRRRQRREQRAFADTARGMIALAEGHTGAARKWLVRAADHSEQPLVPWLLAARAAAADGDHTEAQNFLEQARQSMPGADSAVALTSAELALAADRPEQALAELRRLHAQGERQPRLLVLLAELYERNGAWDELVLLLPELKRERALPAERLAALEVSGWRGRFELAGAAGDHQRLRQLWRDLPRRLERQGAVVASYTGWLAASGEAMAATQLLATQIRRDWQSSLVALYGRIDADAERQLATVEQWLTEHPGDPALLLSAARLARRNQLWGKARSYFEAAIAVAPAPEAYAELAELLDQLGDTAASAELYRRGLRATATNTGSSALPAPAVSPG